LKYDDKDYLDRDHGVYDHKDKDDDVHDYRDKDYEVDECEDKECDHVLWSKKQKE
jgi:hypothetical protein